MRRAAKRQDLGSLSASERFTSGENSATLKAIRTKGDCFL